MRLIDADAMIERLKAWDTNDATDKALYNFALNRVLEAPPVEPEIIRCKDCKFGNTFPTESYAEMPMKCLGIRYGGVYPDWYCEHAERRTDKRCHTMIL